MRSYIGTLVTESLGYCCPWAFFSIYRRTSEIAARLGVCPRTTQRAKARVDDGTWVCDGLATCMKEQVKTVALIGKADFKRLRNSVPDETPREAASLGALPRR